MVTIFAEDYSGLGSVIVAVFILGPIAVGSLITALIGGMSRDAAKRRKSGRFLWAGVIALMLMALLFWLAAKTGAH